MKPPARDPDLAGTLALSTAARRLKMPPTALRRLLGEGKLPFVQIRGRFRIPEDALERFERGSAPDSWER